MTGRPGGELDPLSVLWRHKFGLTVAFLVSALAGFGLSQLQPELWTAESRVFLSADAAFDPLDQRSGGNTQDRFVTQQAELLTSGPVLDRADLPAGVAREDVPDMVDVEASGDSELLTVRATAPDRDDAVALADALPAAYQELVVELVAQDVQRALAVAVDPTESQRVRVAAAVYDDGVALVESAVPPEAPSQPATIRNIVLAATLGGLAYAAVVVVAASRAGARRAHPGAAVAAVSGSTSGAGSTETDGGTDLDAGHGPDQDAETDSDVDTEPAAGVDGSDAPGEEQDVREWAGGGSSQSRDHV